MKVLVEFAVGNYRSFKDKVSLSMVKSPVKEQQVYNIFTAEYGKRNIDLLKSAVIYGANASGKSNLIKAIGFMKDFIHNSFIGQDYDRIIDTEAFKLNTESENNPSYFEIIFIQDNIKYRYGFEVDNKKVYSEWLFHTKKIKEARLFMREKDQIVTGREFSEGGIFKNKVREDSLFLSMLLKLGGKSLNQLRKWFSKFHVIRSLDDYLEIIARDLKNKHKDISRDKVLRLLQVADLSIDDYRVEQAAITGTEPSNKKIHDIVNSYQVRTRHKKYNNVGEYVSDVEFDMDYSESSGTKKIFLFSEPLIKALDNGEIFIIDELDTHLHPLITENIVKLFNSFTNNKNGQLLFATHDIHLLSPEVFRRDQIWFTEKDHYGATDLISLVEYKGVRSSHSYRKHYIFGRYGAIPFTGNFHYFFMENEDEEENSRETARKQEAKETLDNL